MLANSLAEEARTASASTRALLFGLSGDAQAEVQQLELPSYSNHVYDRVANASVSAAGMVLPFALGAALAYGLYHEFNVADGGDTDFGVYLLFIGVAMAITVSDSRGSGSWAWTNGRLRA